MTTSLKRRRGGILFCGGCNPRYDRLAFYEQLLNYYSCGQSSHGPLDKHVPVELDLYEPGQHWDFIAVINGCSSECLIDRGDSLPTVLLSNGVLEDALRKIDALFPSNK